MFDDAEVISTHHGDLLGCVALRLGARLTKCRGSLGLSVSRHRKTPLGASFSPRHRAESNETRTFRSEIRSTWNAGWFAEASVIRVSDRVPGNISRPAD